VERNGEIFLMNNVSDLQTVIDQYDQNPEGAEGFKTGEYSFSFGKIWRGTSVIGYTNPSEEPGSPKILPTSQTSHEEAQIFTSSTVPAAPEPSEMPEMGIESPEGEQSEDGGMGGDGGDGGMGEEPPPEPPEGGTPPPDEGGGGGDSAFKELGAKFGDMKGSDEDPMGATSKFKRPAPKKESLDLLKECRINETKRKSVKSSGYIDFDIVSKEIHEGELVTLYMLPVNRGDGKYELFEYRVTKDNSVPTSYTVNREITSAIKEAVPYVIISDSELNQLCKRVCSVMKAAKDVTGGREIEESTEQAIDRYLREEKLVEIFGFGKNPKKPQVKNTNRYSSNTAPGDTVITDAGHPFTYNGNADHTEYDMGVHHNFTSQRNGSTITAQVENPWSSPKEVHASLEKAAAAHEIEFSKAIHNRGDVRRRQ
jgi:hypothetical protein